MCQCISRVLLAALNAVVGVAAAAFAILFALVQWNESVLESMISSVISVAIEKMNVPSSKETLQMLANEVLVTIRPIALAGFIGMLVVVVICIAGFIGAVINLRILLIIYGAIMGLIVIVHIALLIAYAVKKSELATILTKRYETASEKFISIENGDLNSVYSGLVMAGENCCGYLDGSQFLGSTTFSRRDTFGGMTYSPLLYPVTCCKMENFNIADTTCPAAFDEINSNIHIGCRKAVEKLVIKYLDIAAYTTLVILGGEMVLLILVIIIICTEKSGLEM